MHCGRRKAASRITSSTRKQQRCGGIFVVSRHIAVATRYSAFLRADCAEECAVEGGRPAGEEAAVHLRTRVRACVVCTTQTQHNTQSGRRDHCTKGTTKAGKRARQGKGLRECETRESHPRQQRRRRQHNVYRDGPSDKPGGARVVPKKNEHDYDRCVIGR